MQPYGLTSVFVPAGGPPFLVEIRFPRMGTSSDWALCDDEGDLQPILDRVAAGVELHLHSVWDIADRTGVVIRK